VRRSRNFILAGQITVEQNRKLVDWINKNGKNLTTIYAAHGGKRSTTLMRLIEVKSALDF